MPRLDGKVAIVTGAGRGIGREHALALAEAGATVVVNDLGATLAGEGADATPAQQVVSEIEAAGGTAVANGDDVADFAGAERMVKQALETYGRLDILVNNAGITRDRMLVNMSEEEWDSVLAVHLKGHFAPTRHAAAYWREQAKTGAEVRGRVINTSSPSGVFGNVGQTNYGAAKAGIAGFTTIAAQELARYDVRVNAIAPAAMTRMTEDRPYFQSQKALREEDPAVFIPTDPDNVPVGNDHVFDMTNMPSYRLTIDMRDLDGARLIITTGQSGNPFVRHYNDQIGPWIEGGTVPLPFTPAAISAAEVSALTLTP